MDKFVHSLFAENQLYLRYYQWKKKNTKNKFLSLWSLHSRGKTDKKRKEQTVIKYTDENKSDILGSLTTAWASPGSLREKQNLSPLPGSESKSAV